METIEDDYIEELLMTTSHHYLMFFTNKGKVYRIKGYEIPEGSRSSRGTNVVNILPLEQEEKIFNRQYEELERLQREGKAFLLCPTGRAKVGRLERDPQRLEALYLEGRKAMLDNLPALREFLAK